MFFYEVKGQLPSDHMIVTEQDEDIRNAALQAFADTCTAFFEEKKTQAYAFVARISRRSAVIGILSQNALPTQTVIEPLLEHSRFTLENLCVAETTLRAISSMLEGADTRGYIDDSSEPLSSFQIEALASRARRDFGEGVIAAGTKQEVYAAAELSFARETLLTELDRIYAGTPKGGFRGHPVHYLLQAGTSQLHKELYQTLLQALHANGRLQSQRCIICKSTAADRISPDEYEDIYRVSEGGAVVIRFEAKDNSGGGDVAFSVGDTDRLAQLAMRAKRYCNRVLTLFCLPRACEQLKNVLNENLSSVVLVELQEDRMQGEQAVQMLRRLAKQAHIRADKRLLSEVQADKPYFGAELSQLFQSWYNHKLKSTLFPQYQELHAACESELKTKPKGSAYDELSEMIGLTQAKAVIKKALNYHKLQKLYVEKGISQQRPAMHMVFTGNPGTAKTTVARLVARIMCENGLLSGGQLVEVGRADLVGKYVGWTAPLVQQRFQDAMGGVLFIDEAYSLADGRDGMYGDEAINAIVQEMENRREDMVVIFAGYPDRMQGFLDRNPGLRSRIAFHVPFEDYDAEELCRIAELQGKSKSIRFTPAARSRLKDAFDLARGQADFGNGRYVRNILEQARMNQASRLLELPYDELTADTLCTLQPEDIPLPDSSSKAIRSIGFAR